MVAVFATEKYNPFALVSVALLVSLWFESLYKNRAMRLFNLFRDEDFYDQDYLETVQKIRIYITGILAMAWAVILALLQGAVSILSLH